MNLIVVGQFLCVSRWSGSCGKNKNQEGFWGGAGLSLKAELCRRSYSIGVNATAYEPV